jgi:hypothetical protein
MAAPYASSQPSPAFRFFSALRASQSLSEGVFSPLLSFFFWRDPDFLPTTPLSKERIFGLLKVVFFPSALFFFSFFKTFLKLS